ncbi:MAG: protein kinase family protein [Aquabacterium sp.]
MSAPQHLALTCPQCGGTLPRQAAWRMVACPYCRSVVTRAARVVQRVAFQQALARAAAMPATGERLDLDGVAYGLQSAWGGTTDAALWRGYRAGAAAAQVMVLMAEPGDLALLQHGRQLIALQASAGPGAAYYSQRLPQVERHGTGSFRGRPVQALVLRRPPGYWGSLAQVSAHHSQGLQDVRHAVWLWRRVLDVLGWLHQQGWTHGDLLPAHWLIHPADHGVLLMGWASARRGGDRARDLMQSAWALRQALAPAGDGAPAMAPGLPPGLSHLLRRASEDPDWCARHSAAQVDQQLVAAAAQAFGPARFIPFNPERA